MRIEISSAVIVQFVAFCVIKLSSLVFASVLDERTSSVFIVWCSV